MGEPRVRSFYRVVSGFPPPDGDYTTASERRKGAPPPAYVPPEKHRSWYHGYSSFDTPDGAKALAIRMRGRFGRLIARYDIPEGAGISWEPDPDEPGHFDLYGDKEELKTYLAHDYCETVEIPG